MTRKRTLHGDASRETALALAGLGDALALAGDGAAALERHREALACLDRSGDPSAPVLARVLAPLCDLLLANGRLDEAAPLLERELAALRSMSGDSPARASRITAVLANRGEIAARNGDRDRALASFGEATERLLAPEAADAGMLAPIARRHAELLAGAGRANDALDVLDRALLRIGAEAAGAGALRDLRARIAEPGG